MAKIVNLFERIERMWRRYTHDLVEEKIEGRLKDSNAKVETLENKVAMLEAELMVFAVSVVSRFKQKKPTPDKLDLLVHELSSKYDLAEPVARDLVNRIIESLHDAPDSE